MGLDHSPVTKVTCIMKCFIVVAAFVALACGQQTPDERRKELVDNAWSIASENGCFTRQTSQDLFNTLDGNGDKKVTETEFVEVVSVRLGNKPATCLFNKAAATCGNPMVTASARPTSNPELPCCFRNAAGQKMRT